MRDNATLRTEMARQSVTPYVPCEYSDAATWVDCRERVEDIRYSLEPYGALATIELNNHDKALSAVNFRKRKARIGTGLVVADVGHYSWIPYLWCYAFRHLSIGRSDDYPNGANIMRLHCEGAMNWIARWHVDDIAGYHFNNEEGTTDADRAAGRDNMTIRQIVAYILAKQGIVLGSDYDANVVIRDPHLDDWKPQMFCEVGENGRKIIRDLLKQTSRAMLMPYEDQMRFRVVADADVLDYVYVTPSEL